MLLEYTPPQYVMRTAPVRPETLWVNGNGRRFANESLSILATQAVAKQPGGYLWALFDSPLKDYMIANPSSRQVEMDGEDWLHALSEDLEKEARWKRRTVAVADSWEELAEKLTSGYIAGEQVAANLVAAPPRISLG